MMRVLKAVITAAVFCSAAVLSASGQERSRAAEAQPHLSGKPVFVGHTEQRNSEVLDLGFAICIDTGCCRHGWLTANRCGMT